MESDGKADFELPTRQPFLVDRGDQTPVDQYRRARVMPVPDAQNNHGESFY